MDIDKGVQTENDLLSLLHFLDPDAEVCTEFKNSTVRKICRARFSSIYLQLKKAGNATATVATQQLLFSCSCVSRFTAVRNGITHRRRMA